MARFATATWSNFVRRQVASDTPGDDDEAETFAVIGSPFPMDAPL